MKQPRRVLFREPSPWLTVERRRLDPKPPRETPEKPAREPKRASGPLAAEISRMTRNTSYGLHAGLWQQKD